MPRTPRTDAAPEFLDMEIPGKRSAKPLGRITQSLVDTEVDEKTAAYFERPKSEEMKGFVGRIGSHVAAAKRHAPGAQYKRRIVEFDSGDGVCVWRVA